MSHGIGLIPPVVKSAPDPMEHQRQPVPGAVNTNENTSIVPAIPLIMGQELIK
jgi:hypothetical protein